MRKLLSFLLVLMCLYSCTSNTIFEKPKDLIPRDTMSLLLQEMVIAASAKFTKTKNDKKNINYMPFVYEKFKIDSTRFESSNFYYMSKIDVYKEILEGAKASLESKNDVFKKIKKVLDSVKKDSTKRVKLFKKRLDTLKKLGILDSLKPLDFKKINLDSLKILEKLDTLKSKKMVLDSIKKIKKAPPLRLNKKLEKFTEMQ